MTAAANCLQRIPITDVDRKFMEKQKVRRPNLYDKEDCRDLEHTLRQWERKYMDRRADKLTDRYKVPKREKTDDQAQNVEGDQAQNVEGDQAQNVAGAQVQDVAGDQAQHVAGAQTQDVAGDQAEAALDPTGPGQREQAAAATGDKPKKGPSKKEKAAEATGDKPKKGQARKEKAAAATGDKPNKGQAKKEKAAEASAEPEQQESVKPKNQAGSCDCVMCN